MEDLIFISLYKIWITKCDSKCRAPCSRNIGNVSYMKDSRTDVYKSYQNNAEYGRKIQNDTGSSDVKTRDLTGEIDHYKAQCSLCKLLLPQIRNLVKDISPINLKEIPGICNHCKNINSTHQCKRCTYIMKKYLQENEFYADRCEKECHNILARIKALVLEYDKNEEIMKLRSKSLIELLKNLPQLRKLACLRPLEEIQETEGGGILERRYGFGRSSISRNAPIERFRTSCLSEDLANKLRDKMAITDSKYSGKSFSSGGMSHDHAEKTKNLANKLREKMAITDSKYSGRPFSPGVMSHDHAEKTKNLANKLREKMAITDSKYSGRPFSPGVMSHDHAEKTKNLANKLRDKKAITDSKNNARSFSPGAMSRDHAEKTKNLANRLRDKRALTDSKYKARSLSPGAMSRDHAAKSKNLAIDSNNKVRRKLDYKNKSANDITDQPKKGKDGKTKKQSDKEKEREFSKLSKKIKMHNKSLDLFEKMILKEQKNRKRPNQYNLKKIKIPDLGELPPLPVKTFKEPVPTDSGSILECECSDANRCTDIIEGNHIVHNNRGKRQLKCKSLKPLFFNVHHDFDDESLSKIQSPAHSKIKLSKSRKAEELFGKYKLSNTKYIENGWTVLPSMAFVRRLNIYKMIPCDSKFDWFENHKNQNQMFYDTGELLAEVYDDGLFKWYYRDGLVALDFIDYIDTETNSTKKYNVYDSIITNKGRYQNKVQILASFDDKGCGIVYDRFGCTRIKYNQAEGVLFDTHVGPPCHWNWNFLNEPPKIRLEQKSHCLKPLDPFIENLEVGTKTGYTQKEDEKISLPRSETKISTEYDDKREEIELENLIREKSTKVSMEYTPFEIRSKIFKLNEYFSLRIIGQSKVYILFKHGNVSFKLNVGMKLISNEIVDIKIVDSETDIINS